MAWQPQEEPLRQLAQCLSDSLSGHDPNARKNAGEMLKSAQTSPDIDKYLAYVFSNGQPPAGVNMDATQYFQARAAAAVMLKNDVKTTYKAMPDSTKDYIRSVILVGLQDSASQIRGYAGNVITEIVRQGGIMGWPQILSELIAMVSNAGGNISNQAQEGSMSALLKICEDNKRALDRQYQGQKPLDFIFPKLLELTTSSQPRVRADALAAINVFVPEKPPTVISHIDTLLQQLFSLAGDSSEDVRKHVCRTFVHIADIAPQKITPHMDGLVEFMVTQQRTPNNPDLALDAAEFWLCASEDEKMRGHLGPYLAKIIPVLLASMVYSEDEILRLEGEEEDYEVEDREQDIKPTFASSKAARLTTNANGETVPAANGAQGVPAEEIDDDLSDGEIDDDDDDDEFGDPEEQWNLRKCSAAALDVLASVFHEAVFEATLPYLTNNLNHAEWPNRESAVLALGAIADGCMSVVEPHLPMLTPFLITLLEDPKPVVRQITCWTLGRYSGWASHLDASGKKQFFEPVMEGILMKMLDRNKRVQEAAASAFANLEEKANTELSQYCGVIVRQFVQCFSMYKDRNMFILYDCVQTLAEHVGPDLSNDELVQMLMPALLQRWNKVSDQSREMFPLLECLSYVATALGPKFAPYAAGIFARCIKIIHRNLEEGVMASEINGFEPPDKDFLVTSLDLLSAIIQALHGQDSATLITQAPTFFQLLAVCMSDPNNDVRQSAYALLGDCAIYVFQQLQPCLPDILTILITQLEVSQVDSDGLDTGYSVINNACWSVGEIAMCHKEGMQPYVEKLLQKLGTILFDERVPESLNENAAIALGRLGLGCASSLAVHLAQIAPAFIRAIKKVQWTDEKCHALSGFMLIVLANPGAMEQSLLEFFSDMSMADRNVVQGPAGRQVKDTFQKVIVQYKSMIPNFDAFLGGLPAEQQARFRELYSV
ncbi:ARM repeat-containing protein [Stemphylium lycopersici]|uniref:ARM repeat-containing protein n=1 Tax=Stemphylium lycopersici TaxID=183478 RepID=A0A364N4V0_STELY|nr:importin beta-2 protein [Stemphylium lycopersici]RAR09080.1 ARM repeat-containing protein [Stemphylium lycopersici]RAR11396.1 ARM repeat-containing protein [Stemphylium lycopersici]